MTSTNKSSKNAKRPITTKSKTMSEQNQQPAFNISYEVNAQSMPYLNVKNNMNAKFYPKRHEQPQGPSQTVPNQTMSLREILSRYAKGQPLPSAGIPRYSELDEISLAKMDISERHDLLRSTRSEIKALTDSLRAPKSPEAPTPTPTPQPPTNAPETH